jgi:hypothetical protein
MTISRKGVVRRPLADESAPLLLRGLTGRLDMVHSSVSLSPVPVAVGSGPVEKLKKKGLRKRGGVSLTCVSSSLL